MSSHSDPTGPLLLGIGAGLYTFYKGFRSFREYKVLADTPRMPIRSLPMGFVHIHGKAESANLLTSPVSKTQCCFYRVEIDHWVRHDRSSGWEHFCTDADGYKFYVADETGRVLIDAHSAEYDLPQIQERIVDSAAGNSPANGANSSDLLKYVEYAKFHHMTDSVSQWLDRKVDQAQQKGSVEPSKLQGLESLRQIMHAIPDVQKTGRVPVGLMEQVLAARGPLADPQREARRQLALEHLRQAGSIESLGFTLPNASNAAEGRYRLREYVVVPGQQYFVSGTCCENRDASDSLDRNLIAKGQNEPTFVISSQADQQAVGKVERGSVKKVFLGAALTLGCLALLLWHLNLF